MKVGHFIYFRGMVIQVANINWLYLSVFEIQGLVNYIISWSHIRRLGFKNTTQRIGLFWPPPSPPLTPPPGGARTGEKMGSEGVGQWTAADYLIQGTRMEYFQIEYFQIEYFQIEYFLLPDVIFYFQIKYFLLPDIIFFLRKLLL